MLEIRLLGRAAFAFAGRPYRFSAPPKTVPLLAWLLLNGRVPVARETLAATLWPEADVGAARRDLRRHIYYLLKALPPQGGEPWLEADKKSLRWNGRASVWFDAFEFERRTASRATRNDAIELYRGPLLDGYEGAWFEPERARLHELAVHTLLQLAARDEAAAPDRALAYAHRLLVLDPWREDGLRAVMRIRALRGDGSGALVDYRAFVERLRQDIGIAPMPDTIALAEAIVRGDAGTSASGALRLGFPRANFPPRVDATIGAERARVEARAVLETTRLATLTGASGTGKTRLAADVAWDARAAFPDGIWFVDCVALRGVARLPQAIAAAARVALSDRADLWDASRALRGRHALLVLDGCDRIAADLVRPLAEFGETCDGVRVLATCRSRLEVPGARAYRVPSLDLPSQSERATPERALAYGAVRLFVARAVAVHPGFALDASNAAAVVDVCRALDGIPFAIELAAARVDDVAPRALARDLVERIRALCGPTGAGVSRHTIVRTTVAWSLDRTPETERSWLGRLAESGDILACAEPEVTNLGRRGLLAVIASADGKRYCVPDAVRACVARSRGVTEAEVGTRETRSAAS